MYDPDDCPYPLPPGIEFMDESGVPGPLRVPGPPRMPPQDPNQAAGDAINTPEPKPTDVAGVSSSPVASSNKSTKPLLEKEQEKVKPVESPNSVTSETDPLARSFSSSKELTSNVMSATVLVPPITPPPGCKKEEDGPKPVITEVKELKVSVAESTPAVVNPTSTPVVESKPAAVTSLAAPPHIAISQGSTLPAIVSPGVQGNTLTPLMVPLPLAGATLLPQGTVIGPAPPGAVISHSPQGTVIGPAPPGAVISHSPQGTVIGPAPPGSMIGPAPPPGMQVVVLPAPVGSPASMAPVSSPLVPFPGLLLPPGTMSAQSVSMLSPIQAVPHIPGHRQVVLPAPGPVVAPMVTSPSVPIPQPSVVPIAPPVARPPGPPVPPTIPAKSSLDSPHGQPKTASPAQIEDGKMMTDYKMYEKELAGLLKLAKRTESEKELVNRRTKEAMLKMQEISDQMKKKYSELHAQNTVDSKTATSGSEKPAITRPVRSQSAALGRPASSTPGPFTSKGFTMKATGSPFIPSKPHALDLSSAHPMRQSSPGLVHSGGDISMPPPRAHSRGSTLKVIMDKPPPAHSKPVNYSMYSQLKCTIDRESEKVPDGRMSAPPPATNQETHPKPRRVRDTPAALGAPGQPKPAARGSGSSRGGGNRAPPSYQQHMQQTYTAPSSTSPQTRGSSAEKSAFTMPSTTRAPTSKPPPHALPPNTSQSGHQGPPPSRHSSQAGRQPPPPQGRPGSQPPPPPSAAEGSPDVGEDQVAQLQKNINVAYKNFQRRRQKQQRVREYYDHRIPPTGKQGLQVSYIRDQVWTWYL